IWPRLATNELQVMFAASVIKPMVDAGKVVALAVASPRRLAQMPNVPTMREAGFPSLDNIGFWIGLAAPPETPRQDVAKLNPVFAATITSSDVVKVLDANVFIPVAGPPEELGTRIRTEMERLRPVVKKLNLKME